MAFSYAPDVQKALQRKLHEVFLDAQVQEAQVQWLIGKNITTIATFNDLADNCTQVAEKIAKPAGLDSKDSIACQPLKTAWRLAEAIVRAELEARARGEDREADTILAETARKRIDSSWIEHHKISFPPTWVPANSTLGTVKRHIESRAATTIEIHKVKCLVEREARTDAILLKLKPTKTSIAHEEITEEQHIATLWEFVYKHRTLMLAYAMAVAPEWKTADLSLLLEYHEFVISKALEQDRGRRPQLRSIIQADYDTRGRWMLFLREFPDKNLADAVRHHQGQSAFLWAGIHTTVVQAPAGRPEKAEARPRRRSRTRSPQRVPWGKDGETDKGSVRRAGSTGSFLEKYTPAGEPICVFFNKGKCNRGAQCKNMHVCDYPKCFGKHPHHQKHVTRPPSGR